jgi:streptomycin 6-kinase
MVRVLAVSDSGVELEQVVPGTDASGLDDDEATVALARALSSMWRPVPDGCGLPTVAQECEPLTASAVPHAREACEVLDGLLADAPTPVVLHGDLHHGNLLRGPAGWVAIDPHGLVGDPGYDVGPLLINPWGAEVASLVPRRLEVLARELELDPERLRRRGFVRAVLSAAWTLADTGKVDERVLRVAAALRGGA